MTRLFWRRNTVGVGLAMIGCSLVGLEGAGHACQPIVDDRSASIASRDIEVVAHKGFAGCFPENTLEAIGGALGLGFNSIELDVQVTRDTVLILMHDSTVSRTTGGHGLVRRLSVAEIRRLNACPTRLAPCRIPTLDAALEVGGESANFLLDLKGPFVAEARAELMRVLRSLGAVGRTRLLTERLELLRALRDEYPGIAVDFSYVGRSPWEQISGELRALGVESVVLSVRAIRADNSLIDKVRGSGFSVSTATITSGAEFNEVAANGVRRMLSDFPILVTCDAPWLAGCATPWHVTEPR